jgi:hypothetical protein
VLGHASSGAAGPRRAAGAPRHADEGHDEEIALDVTISPGRRLGTLAESLPELGAEWHETRNDGLRPDDVSVGSSRRVWWRCAAGHEWQARIGNRARGGTGCPFCAGTRPTDGDCLATTHPALAAQWHPTRNGVLTPALVRQGSNRLAWWRCEEGHEWWARIRYRAQVRFRCPACERARACSENSLASTSPALTAEWHPTRNGALTPDQVSDRSRRRVWWRCEAGHEWSATVVARARDERGCPGCPGRIPHPSPRRLAA